MKLLFLVNAFPSPDIPNKGSFNLTAIQSISKHIPVVIVHLRSFRPGRKIIDQYNFEGVDVIAFSWPFIDSLGNRTTAFLLGFYKIVAFLMLRKLCDGVNVIHSVGASHAGVVGAYFSKKMKIKHVAQFIGSDINFILPKIGKYSGVKGWHKNVDVMVANSKGLANTVYNLYKIQPKVIYRGVNLNVFKNSSDKKIMSDCELSFLYLGGLSPRKGNPYGMNLKGGIDLLKAWIELLKLGVIGNSKLYFGGPDVSVDKIESIIKHDVQSCRIEPLSYLNKASVIEYMKMAHVLVVPSMAEGLPNVVMEASSCGCAVIGSDVGGTGEVIEHSKTGLLFEAGNVKMLSSCLKYFLENPYKCIEMGVVGREKMKLEFDSVNFSYKYISIYEAN